MIQVENVSKRYGQRTAVDKLTFTVNQGEILGFLGPNGAGKSTTMNIITGYLSATEGSVKVDGHDILEEPHEVKQRIGYMPELPPLYPDMTVQELPRVRRGDQGRHARRAREGGGPGHGDAAAHRRARPAGEEPVQGLQAARRRGAGARGQPARC